MVSVLIQVLFGVYLGILTGIIPAVIAWTLGFSFRYITGVTVPGFAVVVFGVAMAGINGGFLALNDPTITRAPNSVALVVALLVVLLLGFYAHAKGDQMGAAFPHRLSISSIRSRQLSADVIELVGGRHQVRVTVAGEVGDLEGYPPLPEPLRQELSAESWPFPSDLPIEELETRLADKLRTEYDLAEVTVRIDERARASIEAAPPQAGVSKRVPAGKRAVSIETLLPTGIARGDVVSVLMDGDEDTTSRIEGTVVSAHAFETAADSTPVTDGGETQTASAPRAPTTAGGEGRLTIAVDQTAASRLLDIDRARTTVTSRGTRREFELLSLLRRAGKRISRLQVGATSPLLEAPIGRNELLASHDVLVLAVRQAGSWTIAPGNDTRLQAGDTLILAGGWTDLDRFEEGAT